MLCFCRRVLISSLLNLKKQKALIFDLTTGTFLSAEGSSDWKLYSATILMFTDYPSLRAPMRCYFGGFRTTSITAWEALLRCRASVACCSEMAPGHPGNRNLHLPMPIPADGSQSSEQDTVENLQTPDSSLDVSLIDQHCLQTPSVMWLIWRRCASTHFWKNILCMLYSFHHSA